MLVLVLFIVGCTKQATKTLETPTEEAKTTITPSEIKKETETKTEESEQKETKLITNEKQTISKPSEEECLQQSTNRVVNDVWKGLFKMDLSFSVKDKVAIIDITRYDFLDDFVGGASDSWKQAKIKEQLLIIATDLIMELDERGCINAIDSYKMSFKGYSYIFSKYEIAEATGFADDMDLE